MYSARLGDESTECTVEAIRLTWDRRRLDAATRSDLRLRLSRLLDSDALSFCFDFEANSDDLCVTIYPTRQSSGPDRMPVETAQIMLLDRCPGLSVEAAARRDQFDRWAQNRLPVSAHPTIKTFVVRRGGEQAAVLPWIEALVTAIRRTRSAAVRAVLCVRPFEPDPALVAQATALIANTELDQKLPPELLRRLWARISVIPNLRFLVEATILAKSEDEIADVDRAYRDELAAATGLPNASALSPTGAPKTLVPDLTLHASYLSSERDPRHDLLSHGCSRAELVAAIVDLLIQDDQIRPLPPDATVDEPPADGSPGITVQQRSDSAYYNLAPPAKAASDYVFVSYRQTHIRELAQVLDHLAGIGVSFWYDRGIGLSQEWDTEIEKRISGCRSFVALLGNSYFASKVCRREFKFADCLGKKIVALAYEPLKPSGGMALVLSSLQVGFLQDSQIGGFIAEALRAQNEPPRQG
jgi:TIR domain